MASFFVQKELTQTEVNESLSSLSDLRIEEVTTDNKGYCVILTKWIKYTVVSAKKNGKTKILIKSKWNPNKMVLIFFFGVPISLFMSKTIKNNLKDISDLIFKELSK